MSTSTRPSADPATLELSRPRRPEPDRGASPTSAEPRSRPDRPLRATRVFLLGFVGFFVLFATWAVATPPFAAPDEQYHISRAASVVRGVIVPPGNDTFGGGAGVVIEPTGIGLAAASWRCVQHHLHRTAACAEDTPSDSSPLAVFSGAARYAPAYYAVVGWPTLGIFDSGAVIPMRLISAAWCAAMLAAALVTALQLGRHRWLPLGLLAAVTPQVAWLSGTVNPNAVEICAAVLAWTAGLAVVCTQERAPAAWLRRFAVGATCLVLMRQLSPLWLAGIVAACLVIAGLPTLRRLARRPGVYLSLVPPFVATLLQLGWIYVVGTGDIPVGALRNAPTGFTLPAVLGLQPERWSQYVGDMGWLDVPLPVSLAVTWGLVWVGLAVLGLRRTTVHGRWSLGLVILGILLTPVLLEWPLTHRIGFYWQGRYALPIAVGIPLVATACLSLGSRVRDPSRWVRLAVVVVTGGVGLFAFVRVFMRYSSDYYHLSIFGPWQPPVPFLLLVGAFVGAVALLAWLAGTRRPIA